MPSAEGRSLSMDSEQALCNAVSRLSIFCTEDQLEEQIPRTYKENTESKLKDYSYAAESSHRALSENAHKEPLDSNDTDYGNKTTAFLSVVTSSEDFDAWQTTGQPMKKEEINLKELVENLPEEVFEKVARRLACPSQSVKEVLARIVNDVNECKFVARGLLGEKRKQSCFDSKEIPEKLQRLQELVVLPGNELPSEFPVFYSKQNIKDDQSANGSICQNVHNSDKTLFEMNRITSSDVIEQSAAQQQNSVSPRVLPGSSVICRNSLQRATSESSIGYCMSVSPSGTAESGYQSDTSVLQSEVDGTDRDPQRENINDVLVSLVIDLMDSYSHGDFPNRNQMVAESEGKCREDQLYFVNNELGEPDVDSAELNKIYQYLQHEDSQDSVYTSQTPNNRVGLSTTIYPPLVTNSSCGMAPKARVLTKSSSFSQATNSSVKTVPACTTFTTRNTEVINENKSSSQAFDLNTKCYLANSNNDKINQLINRDECKTSVQTLTEVHCKASPMPKTIYQKKVSSTFSSFSRTPEMSNVGVALPKPEAFAIPTMKWQTQSQSNVQTSFTRTQQTTCMMSHPQQIMRVVLCPYPAVVNVANVEKLSPKVTQKRYREIKPKSNLASCTTGNNTPNFPPLLGLLDAHLFSDVRHDQPIGSTTEPSNNCNGMFI